MVARTILLHMKAGFCAESHDFKSKGWKKSNQISSEWEAPSVAAAISLQSHRHRCGSLSRTTNIADIAVFGLRKLLEMSPVLAGFSHIHNQRAWRRERRAGQESFWAASNSGANGFESLGSVIKNWLKISWSILLSLQKIFSLQICGQCI